MERPSGREFDSSRSEGRGPGLEGSSSGVRGPPAEALSACNGLEREDSCTFKMNEREVNGSCNVLSGNLTCMPEFKRERFRGDIR